jgi:hypothetical protein
MPDMEDPSQKQRKHRIIHWNPEDEEAAEKARSSRNRLITLSVIAGVVVIGVISLITLWDNPDKDAKALATRLGVMEEELPKRDFREAFASRAKADLEKSSRGTHETYGLRQSLQRIHRSKCANRRFFEPG